MEIILVTHVNVDKKIFNPHGRIRRSIVLLDVHGFEPLRKLVLHYLIGKAHGVCGTSIPGDIATEFGRHLCSGLTPGLVMFVVPGLMAVMSRWSVSS